LFNTSSSPTETYPEHDVGAKHEQMIYIHTWVSPMQITSTKPSSVQHSIPPLARLTPLTHSHVSTLHYGLPPPHLPTHPRPSQSPIVLRIPASSTPDRYVSITRISPWWSLVNRRDRPATINRRGDVSRSVRAWRSAAWSGTGVCASEKRMHARACRRTGFSALVVYIRRWWCGIFGPGDSIGRVGLKP